MPPIATMVAGSRRMGIAERRVGGCFPLSYPLTAAQTWLRRNRAAAQRMMVAPVAELK